MQTHVFHRLYRAKVRRMFNRCLMGIYYRMQVKLSECCHRIVKRCTGLSMPIFGGESKLRSSDSKQFGDDSMTIP